MSDEDRLILSDIVEQERTAYSARIAPDKFFEIFTAEQILKSRSYDLASDQIAAGVIGGGGDGGVDSLYLMVNNKMVREDTDLSAYKDQRLTIDLVIIQSKTEASFGETAIKNLSDFVDNCLRLSTDLSKVSTQLYRESLLKIVSSFHAVYRGALSQRPALNITCYYATLGEMVDPKVQTRADLLKGKLQEFFSRASVDFVLAGAKKLLEWFYIVPSKTLTLQTRKQMPGSKMGKSYVSLVPLLKFYRFITEHDKLLERIFEANVRDYQGEVQVNKDIFNSLAGVAPEDFWWLNNGITIVASEVRGDDDILSITDPLIVNGLQTSYEIFNYFRDSQIDDDRTILVRVIESKDPEGTNRIIKATNSQTKIPRMWLHATEDIHRTIEAALSKVGLYYDRRKNFYRNQGVSPRQIVTIPYLSQALVALVLQKPDDARARPTTAAERHYGKLFSEKFPKEMYSTSALIIKRIDEFLYGVDLETGHKANIRFYLAMFSVCVALKSAHPRKATIAAFNMDLLTDEHLLASLHRVHADYMTLGGDDVTAKGTELNATLQAELEDRYRYR